MNPKQDAVRIFSSAVNAVHPARLLPAHLSVEDDSLNICGHRVLKNSIKQTYVIGAGKASAAMAAEAGKILGEYISGGLVTTKYGHAMPAEKIRITEAAHPVPDESGVKAVVQTLELLKKAGKDDIIICLISGGASALWCDVPQGITLPEIQVTFNGLIKSGASIREINIVRKHLSSLKGGQLVRHCGGARVFSLIISDVPGDDMQIIASGPTVADGSTFRDANDILTEYQLLSILPGSIRQHIKKGMQGLIEETPRPGDPLFSGSVNRIIGNNRMALLAAAKMAEMLGYHTHIIGDIITGDTEAEAIKLAALAAGFKGDLPACILQGGETTIKVTGNGKGGRNQHFALSALNALAKESMADDLWPPAEGFRIPAGKITILSGGTDGTDGPTDAAGGVVDTGTLHMASQKSLSVEAYLKNHDAYHFLDQTGSLLVTGPTQTNVMDIMMAIVT